MYIFKYHPDNNVYQSGVCVGAYSDFINARPDFPMPEGQYCEYREDGFDLINQGCHLPQSDLTRFQDLITAINNLGVSYGNRN